jgi:hypothetical protein
MSVKSTPHCEGVLRKTPRDGEAASPRRRRRCGRALSTLTRRGRWCGLFSCGPIHSCGVRTIAMPAIIDPLMPWVVRTVRRLGSFILLIKVPFELLLPISTFSSSDCSSPAIRTASQLGSMSDDIKSLSGGDALTAEAHSPHFSRPVISNYFGIAGPVEGALCCGCGISPIPIRDLEPPFFFIPTRSASAHCGRTTLPVMKVTFARCQDDLRWSQEPTKATNCFTPAGAIGSCPRHPD